MNDDTITKQGEISDSSQALIAGKTINPERRTFIGLVILVIVLVALFVLSLIYLFSPSTAPVTVARIRDVFVIIMAIESLFVGLVLVILLVQLARLTNLLQNEIKPILDSTNETISNLRGTTEFLSTNLAEPVIKLNEYMAGLHKLTEILGLSRKR